MKMIYTGAVAQNPVTVGKSIHFHEGNPMDLPYPL